MGLMNKKSDFYHKLGHAALGTLCISALASLAVVSHYYISTTPDTAKGVKQTVKDCGDCTECFKCLDKDSGQDLDNKCVTLNHVVQCAEQIDYLYTNENNKYPCYDKCHGCDTCLGKSAFKTAFETLKKDSRTLWEATYPHLFTKTDKKAAGFMGDDGNMGQSDFNGDINITFAAESSDVCCGTGSDQKPYVRTYTTNGVTWYPVWLYIPWHDQRPYQYQFYYRTNCYAQDCAYNLECQPRKRDVTFLMSSIEPSKIYGYTFKLLLLPNDNLQFMNIPLDSYCEALS